MLTPTPSLEELFLIVFVTVDDLYHRLVPDEVRFRPSHERIAFTDSEVITLSLVGEALSNDSEDSFYRFIRRNYLGLFPKLIDRSRYHRRRKALMSVQLHLFQHVAAQLDQARRLLIIDSAPVETVGFCRSQTGRTSIPEAEYGFVASKQKHFFGFKLHALVNAVGVMVDFTLSPADLGERIVASEMLSKHVGRSVIADSGYDGPDLPMKVARQGNCLLALARPSSKAGRAQPRELRARIKSRRAMVESVFSVLADQFKLETTRARTLWGVKTRLIAKLLAYNLSRLINRQLGRPEMAIKSLFA